MILLVALGAQAGRRSPAPAASGTTSFVLDGDRVYAALGFVRADGSIHRSLAYVDMGSPEMEMTESLLRDLGAEPDGTIEFRVGEFAVRVPVAQIARNAREGRRLGGDLKVEAILPAGVLEKFQVALDYKQRTLTLAEPGALEPEGIATPFRIKSETGLISVDATIAGKPYAVTIDNGSAYTWLRQDVVSEWVAAHPDWQRGVGAVGPANMRMAGDGMESEGILARVPDVKIGGVALERVGVLGAGPGKGMPGRLGFFDWYSNKNAAPVIGWIGGNVLKNFKLTVDYPNRTIYWLKQAEPDPGEMNFVGLVLASEHGNFFVDAVATKNGKPTVSGAQRGDKLLRVGDLDLAHASWGEIFDALHGRAGEMRKLVLERGGKELTIEAPVTAF